MIVPGQWRAGGRACRAPRVLHKWSYEIASLIKDAHAGMKRVCPVFFRKGDLYVLRGDKIPRRLARRPKFLRDD